MREDQDFRTHRVLVTGLIVGAVSISYAEPRPLASLREAGVF